jgi:hypothetical protein
VQNAIYHLGRRSTPFGRNRAFLSQDFLFLRRVSDNALPKRSGDPCKANAGTVAAQYGGRSFFIRKGSHPSVAEDLCVFLPLSVSIRTDHYDACLTAKVAQLDEIFSARVGWLTGNMYSRVATPDVEERMANAEEFKETFYREALFERTAWLSPTQLRLLKRRAVAWQKSNPGSEINLEVARSLLEGVPSMQEIAIERIVELLRQKKILDSEAGTDVAARNVLLSDPTLSKLLS